MTDSVPPGLSKWPFLLGDLLLVGLAGVIAWRGSSPLTLWQGALCLAAVAAGAWFCVLPFLREYEAGLKLREADVLANTVAQLGNLEQIKRQIAAATAQWQSVQDQSTQTVAAAKEVTDRMQKELAEFCSFLRQAHDKEKNHLRLEVEKLRRGEREWLQATVHLLDHVFALRTAGGRSGQPALIAQLNRFHLACRDAVRRLGVVDFAPDVDTPFDPQVHQPDNLEVKPDAGSRVAEILAPGYTFQGELIRRALVRVQAPAAAGSQAPEAEGEQLLI